MTALPGEVPGTQEPVYLFYSNDAGTLLYPVAPSTPLPVTSSAAPGSVQAVEGVLSTTVTNTQVTVPATANGILLLAANPARLGAIISNANAVPVYWSSASVGLTTSNGGEIVAGGSLNIDIPLYTGALYGIVSTGTAVVTVTEFTA